MSSFFIKHPTIAIVISIVMILLGGLSLMGLPIEQYPNIVPPTIKMQATYPGANAETVANSVASPIEQSISGGEAAGAVFKELDQGENFLMMLYQWQRS